MTPSRCRHQHDGSTTRIRAVDVDARSKKEKSRTEKCDILYCSEVGPDGSNIVQAAEKSLGDLKALPRTSESQIVAGLFSFAQSKRKCSNFARDLRARPGFVRPFVVACATRNAKFATSAIVCLLRLIVTQALAKETLSDVLDALRECSTLGELVSYSIESRVLTLVALDIQLKVLQAVPSLLQNYASNLTGPLLTTTYQVAFLLYGSKTPVVSNTAAAALQQLVNSTFEKAGSNDGALSPLIIYTRITNGE